MSFRVKALAISLAVVRFFRVFFGLVMGAGILGLLFSVGQSDFVSRYGGVESPWAAFICLGIVFLSVGGKRLCGAAMGLINDILFFEGYCVRDYI